MVKLFTLAFILIILTNQLELGSNMPQPQYKAFKYPPTPENVHANKVLSFYFPEVNYEISSHLYTHSSILSTEQKYNQSAYDNAMNKYCSLYSTDFKITSLSDHKIASKPLLWYTKEREKNNALFLINENKMLDSYVYDSMNIWLKKSYQIPESVVKFGITGIDSIINFVQINKNLLIFNFYDAYLLNQESITSNFIQIQGLEDDVIKAGIHSQKDSQIWILDRSGISIYKYNSNQTLSCLQRNGNLSNIVILDVQVQKSFKKTVFYLLSVNKLYILSIPFEGQSKTKEYQLQGSCENMKKIQNILYLMCAYEKINYMMEVRIQQNMEDLIINRYYDDRFLQGIWNVQKMGKQKIILIGDNQIQIVGLAVNVNYLLKIANKGKKQSTDSFFKYRKIQDIINISKGAKTLSSQFLLIAKQNVAIIKFSQNPPEVQCIPKKIKGSYKFSMSAVFKTTSCPEQIEKVDKSSRICEIWYPFQITVDGTQFQKGTAFVSIFGIIILLLILTLVFLGWFFTFRDKMKEIKQKVVRKIKKFREKDGLQKVNAEEVSSDFMLAQKKKHEEKQLED